MIVRIWEGKTKNEDAEKYKQVIEQRDVSGYQSTPGFIKHSFLMRKDKSITFFKLLTYWADTKAITKFTGPKMEEAVGFDVDQPFVIDFPGSVSHFEVFSE